MDTRINEHVHFIEKIADTSPGIIYVYDLTEQKEIYSNGKTKALLGYTHEEFLSFGPDTLKHLQHADDATNATEHFKEFHTIKDGEIRSFEHRLKTKDGSYKWIRNYQSVFKRNEEKVPIQIIGITMDIENEKQMAADLISHEEQLLEAQKLAEMGSFKWDLVNDTSEVTPETREILALDEQTKFDEFMHFVHPSDRKNLKEALDKAVNETGLYDYEFRYNAGSKEKIIWSKGVVEFKDGKGVMMKGTVMDVTDRHHMIQRLKRSEDLYKQAQALTHLGNWTWEVRSNKITWTDEMYRIFGLEPQSREITFNFLLSYLHPRDKGPFLQHVGQLSKLSTTAQYHPRIILPDHTIKILNVKAEALADEDGPYKIIGTAQDITEQKQTEKKLRENQNFIKKITDAAPSIIAAYNIHNGKYLFINQAFEKLLGYPAQQVLEEGTDFFVQRIHPDDLMPILDKNNQALELANKPGVEDNNEIIVEFKYRMRHKNGGYRWFHTYGTVFDRNEHKQVEHVLNISIDISEQVEAETKVLEQEHFIQHIADASPTILYLYDLPTRSIIYTNEEVTPVLGYTPGEVIEMGDAVNAILFHPDDVELIVHKHDMIHAENSFIQYECRMREKNKGWRDLLIREIAFKLDDEAKPVQMLCAALDITDRKEMEKALQQKTLQLQQSNSSLEEFAYVASHDLKEPLRKISTFGDRLLLKEHDNLNEESKMYLEKIIDSTQRMQQMINDLLSISMLSTEKTFESFSLQSIMQEVLETLEFKIEESNAIIQYDQLPKAYIIPSQFRQLFQNLISNSLKFSHKNVQPVISVTHKYLDANAVTDHSLTKAGKYLQLIFADNGIGFDEHNAEKIFAIFQRLHARNEYEGTGIGLAVCRKIVENHGGKIYATSEQNKGAKFSIILPA